MKSLVTMRTVLPGASGGVVGSGPGGASHTLSITALVPLQCHLTHMPEYCGVRPVAVLGSHDGLKPFSSAAIRSAYARVSTTVALPNGSTANTSPQVTWFGCSPPVDADA